MKQLRKKAEKNIEERLKVIREKIEKAKKKKSNHNTGGDLENVRDKVATVGTMQEVAGFARIRKTRELT